MTLTWDDTDLGVGQDLYRVDANTGEQVLLTASVANGVEGYSNPVGDYAPDKQIIWSNSTLTAEGPHRAKTVEGGGHCCAHPAARRPGE
jgi:hypothetical protein